LLVFLFHSAPLKYDFVSYLRIGQGARWNFQHCLRCTYCAVSVGPAIYSPISLVSRQSLIKLGRSKPSTGQTIPQVEVRISRLSTLKSVRISELLLRQPMSNAAGQETSCRRRFVLLQSPLAALRFIIKGLTFAYANHDP
jgi:hypothetical protein